MTYRVSGEAHGSSFEEGGFATDVEAMAYASSIIDGDVDSTVEITPEAPCKMCKGSGKVTPKANPFRAYVQNEGRTFRCPKCKGTGREATR